MIMTETTRVLIRVALAAPGNLFLWAFVLELRRDRQSLISLRRLLPLLAGASGWALGMVPLTLLIRTPHSSMLLGRVMAAVSLCIAVCGILCGFRSKLAAALVVAGGAILAFFWLFNQIVV